MRKETSWLLVVSLTNYLMPQILSMVNDVFGPSNRIRQVRFGACSFIYKNCLFVVGGGLIIFHATLLLTDYRADEHYSKFRRMDYFIIYNLPTKTEDFKAVVYKNWLIITGGCNRDGFHLDFLSSIYNFSLVPPYAGTLLTRMPQPRVCHGAELMNYNISVVGEKTSYIYQTKTISIVY